MRRSLTGAVLMAIAAANVIAQSCDAQKRALGIFAEQRLNLLRPARDYIQPAGLVFLPKGGPPEYDDPVEPVRPEPGNLTDFRAVILEETRKRSTGFALALGLANWVLPVPVGLKLAGNDEVSLGGIETTGVRLQTTAIDGLLKRNPVANAVVPELKRGLRVFVVQEVYKATSLDLKSSTGQKMDVSFNDGTAVATCARDEAKDAKQGTAAKPDEKKQEKPDEKKQEKPAESKPAETKPAETRPGEAKTGSSTEDKTKSMLPKIGAAVCRASDFSLKFTTTNPIPFAVRLAELELRDGQLRRKRGADVITTTLGPGEISASLVDATEPAVTKLRHRRKE